VYVGPTLSALFHARSAARLDGLNRAYLLYSSGSSHEELEAAVKRIGRTRGIDVNKRVEFVPIEGITDPTHLEGIIKKVEAWLKERERFAPDKRDAAPRPRILVNLSPGTQAMSASWLVLYASGALGGPFGNVEFVQGDGGRDSNDTPDNPR